MNQKAMNKTTELFKECLKRCGKLEFEDNKTHPEYFRVYFKLNKNPNLTYGPAGKYEDLDKVLESILKDQPE